MGVCTGGSSVDVTTCKCKFASTSVTAEDKVSPVSSGTRSNGSDCEDPEERAEVTVED